MTLSPIPKASSIKAVLLDFGGVIAEEGFREGLRTIAMGNGLDPQAVINIGFAVVFELGFVTGQGTEEEFWKIMRAKAKIQGRDEDLREIILSRFIPRPWMLDLVRRFRAQGITTAILSDQVHWLDELDRRHHFFGLFDRVFNSYYLGISKKDPAIFHLALDALNVSPQSALFVDDNAGNVTRAREVGLIALLFETRERFLADIHSLDLI